MTTVVVVSVYDTVANLYGAPFVAINEQVAVRQFIAEQQHPNGRSPMQTHPTDFRLFKLGTFDDQRGAYELLSQPEFLYQGVAHVAEE